MVVEVASVVSSVFIIPLEVIGPVVTIPVPFGDIAISPLEPSVIVIDPVVELPVFNVTSLSPFDLNTPAADPVPDAISPLISTVPSVALVMVSSFSNVIPPVAEAVITVNVPAAAEFAPIIVPSIAPPLISVVVNTLLPIVIIPVLSAMLPAAVPSFAFILVTSIFVLSNVVAFTVVEANVLIVVALIVPPSTLSPLI